MSINEAIPKLQKTLTKILEQVYLVIVEKNLNKFFEDKTVYINQRIKLFNEKYPKRTATHLKDPSVVSRLKEQTCSYFAHKFMSAYSNEILENFQTVEDYLETIENDWFSSLKDGETIDFFEKNYFSLVEDNVRNFRKDMNQDFEEFKSLKDEVEEAKKKSQNKNLLVYEKFHNIETLPLVTSPFPLTGFDLKETENHEPAEERNVSKNSSLVYSKYIRGVIIPKDLVEELKKFVEQNPAVRFSNSIFDLCAYHCAEECFKYLYSLITEDELKLEAKFYNHAVSNLNQDLNYIGEKFYKVSTKAQVQSKPPDSKKILAGNFSIVSETVFSSAFEALKRDKNQERGVRFFRLLFSYRIVGSDLTKFEMSEPGGKYSGYVSLYGNYLNAGLR